MRGALARLYAWTFIGVGCVLAVTHFSVSSAIEMLGWMRRKIGAYIQAHVSHG